MSALPKFLRHSSPDEPGIARRKRGRGFSYHDETGALIRCETILTRINGLGLPPAYRDVWICRDAHGHLQATGLDDRGRRQYRYHQDWRKFRDCQKFNRLEEFGRGLPRLRERVANDLNRNQPDVTFVTAALVRLIDSAALRIGSPRYAQENGSYGATTLRSRHITLKGQCLNLDFKAKGGKRVRKQLKDRTLSRVLGQIDDLPGRELFRAMNEDGSFQSVLSDDVNRYIGESIGEGQFTAKSFRTWHGTLSALDYAVSEKDRLTIKAMSEATAQRLHNTPSIARSSYIHPDVIALTELDISARQQKLDSLDLRRAPNGLPKNEKRLVSFLSS